MKYLVVLFLLFISCSTESVEPSLTQEDLEFIEEDYQGDESTRSADKYRVVDFHDRDKSDGIQGRVVETIVLKENKKGLVLRKKINRQVKYFDGVNKGWHSIYKQVVIIKRATYDGFCLEGKVTKAVEINTYTNFGTPSDEWYSYDTEIQAANNFCYTVEDNCLTYDRVKLCN